jgi:hypothetical protein
LWLVPASVQIVSWDNAGTARVAVLAPLYLLWIALAAGALLAAATWFAGDRRASTRQTRADSLAPLSVLWLWALPFLPWVPDKLPLVLLLAGVVKWLIFAAVLACVLGRLGRPRLLPPTVQWRTSGAAVFVLSLLIYGGFGLRSLSTVGLSGDEPHYLVITHSLLVDRDIRIENNHARGDYRVFFDGDLRPDYLQRGIDGQIYSIHAPGISALVLPGYAIAGAAGAILTTAFFGALAALAIFETSVAVGGAAAGWATWLAVSLTVPFVPHAWSIYPEIGALAIVAAAVMWIEPLSRSAATMRHRASAGVGAWTIRGVALALLPWLHTKFIVILAALTVWLLFELRHQMRSAVAVALPIVISVMLWLGFFYVLYGTPDPQAPYGSYAAQTVRLENIPRSLMGMLFDQKFGLLVYAPVYAIAAAGAWLLFRETFRRRFVLGLAATAVLYAVVSARYYMWWGGASAPARFLVPVVPLVAPMMAVAFTELRAAARATAWALVALSLTISAASLIRSSDRLLIFSDAHGVSRLLSRLHESVPLTAMLPTFTEEDWLMPAVRLAPWIAAAGIAFLVVRVVERRYAWSAFALLSVEGGVAFAICAILAPAPVPGARIDAAVHGRLAVLDAFDPRERRAFDYHSMSKLSPDAWKRIGAISLPVDDAHRPDGYGRLFPGVPLAPGRFEARISFADRQPHPGNLTVELRRDRALETITGPLVGAAHVQFGLPVEMTGFSLRLTDIDSARAVQKIDITPIDVVPVSERTSGEAQAIEPIPGRPHAFMVYLDDRTFPEGGVFWTAGTTRGDILVVPDGAQAIDLTLHVGPSGGTVHLAAANHDQTFAMESNATRTISVPVGPGAEYVRIAVWSAAAFRPAEVDPRSSDPRLLGVQVRVAVH